MAGVTKEKIHNGIKNVKVCRCMPNTPALIGKGMTAIDTSEIADKDKEFIINLFNSVGTTIETTEGYLNAVTAVSGSDPAFVYKLSALFSIAAKGLGFNTNRQKP
jgi:pyrroline-5-carboxylate reductase